MLKKGEHITFACPFCGLKVTAGNIQMEDGSYDDAVLHVMPMCDKFDALEPDDFMVAVNDATLDPVALAAFRKNWNESRGN